MTSISLADTNSTTTGTSLDHVDPLKDMSWSLLLSSMKRKPMEPHVHKDEDTPSSQYFSMTTTIKNNSFMKSIRGWSQRYKSRSITFSKEAPKTTNQPPEKTSLKAA